MLYFHAFVVFATVAGGHEAIPPRRLVPDAFYSLPFFFTYMMLKNGASPAWVESQPVIPKFSILVCNSVAQSIIEGQRGKHPVYVFPYQGHRVETMNNGGWQRARKEAGLPDLHVHDLRHTVGV